uniref:Uncharacterized protein n=1 Tax=Ananas comosus var. bracteatus TaxID=296719 RepID=A0A6V7PF80_ANACO|nr:unnamed protein product [Ananas comosus var. bracteatus]
MGTEVLRPQDCLREIVEEGGDLRGSEKVGGLGEARRRGEAAAGVEAGRVGILKRGGRRGEEGGGGVGGGGVRGGAAGAGPARHPEGAADAAAAAEEGGDAYAGSAFAASPSPRALPLPRFPRRSEAAAEATRALRRLLRLE